MAERTPTGHKDLRKRLLRLIRRVSDSYRESTQRVADQVTGWLQPGDMLPRPKPAGVRVPANTPVVRRRRH